MIKTAEIAYGNTYRKSIKMCQDLNCDYTQDNRCDKKHYIDKDFGERLSYRELKSIINDIPEFRPQREREIITRSEDLERNEENKYRLEYAPIVIANVANQNHNEQSDVLKRFKINKSKADTEFTEGCSLLSELKNNNMISLACITCYSEYGNQFSQSLIGCVRNIAELHHEDPQVNSYDRFGIVLVCDGVEKIDDSFAKVLLKHGLYDPYLCASTMLKIDQNKYRLNTFDKFEKNKDGKYKIEALHNYAYTTTNISHMFCKKLSWNEIKQLLDEKVKGNDRKYACNYHDGNKAPSEWVLDGIEQYKDSTGQLILNEPEINLFIVIKHENSGKIDSHQWFFKGFCEYFNPEYAILIDIGTIPMKRSISYIIQCMNDERRIGGACGEIEITKENKCDIVRWIEKETLIYAQYAEYKISHYLDKAAESSLGFVSVLPGAFSVFRWDAVKGTPLKQFFKGLDKSTHSAEEANMYLAEDRIMCLEILVKHSKDYLLRYIPGAKALTDPPVSIIELIKQRRRWINGSLFASYYVISHMSVVSNSKHSWCRRMVFYAMILFMLLQFIFSLLLVGSLFSTYAMFINAYYGETANDEECKFSLSNLQNILIRLYWVILFIFIIFSVTKPIEKSQWIYRFIVYSFGILVLAVLALGIRNVYFMITQTGAYYTYFILGVTAGVYILPLLLNLELCSLQLLKYGFGCLCLTFYTPLYINIFLTYSIANLHDISWGTRGTIQEKQNDTQKNLEQFRATNLILWLFVNAIVGYGTLYLQTSGQTTYLIVISLMVCVTLFIKLVLCTWFSLRAKWIKIKLRCCKCCKKDRNLQRDNNDSNAQEYLNQNQLEENRNNNYKINNDIIDADNEGGHHQQRSDEEDD